MKKFLFTYNASPAEGTDSMEEWMAWFDSNGHHLVDVGNPIVGGVLVKGAESSDLTSFSDLVGGYSLINVNDIGQAVALAKSCPNASGLRIFETQPM